MPGLAAVLPGLEAVLVGATLDHTMEGVSYEKHMGEKVFGFHMKSTGNTTLAICAYIQLE